MSTEPLDKNVGTDESDPQVVANHANDEPGSFLALYRSLSASHIEMDEHLVRGSVDNSVIPASIRYGVMRRGNIEAYRGIVKSTAGEYYYFNWAPETDFKLVKADDAEKQWDAERLFKSCRIGCDLRKSSAPLDPGESVEEATKEGTEYEDKDGTEKGSVPLPTTGQAPILEDHYTAQQERLTTQRHPGGTGPTSPDSQEGHDRWHGAEDMQQSITRPGDGMKSLGSNDGQQHWSAVDLLKAWGQRMQQTAPRLHPRVSDLEARYMVEVLGISQEQVQKGVQLPPRHRLSFHQWRATQLRGRLAGLERWLRHE